MVKFNIAADVVPPLETVADVPAAPVVVVPTVIVAAAPLIPVRLLLPLLPLSPSLRPCHNRPTAAHTNTYKIQLSYTVKNESERCRQRDESQISLWPSQISVWARVK